MRQAKLYLIGSLIDQRNLCGTDRVPPDKQKSRFERRKALELDPPMSTKIKGATAKDTSWLTDGVNDYILETDPKFSSLEGKSRNAVNSHPSSL